MAPAYSRDLCLLSVGAIAGSALAWALLRLQSSRELKKRIAVPAVEGPQCVAADVEEKAAFLQQLNVFRTGAIVMAMIYLGDELGLYRAMIQRKTKTGYTAPMLAKEAGGLKPRFVQEWLAGQAAAGIVDFDETSSTFTLPKSRIPFLAHELSGSFFAPYATLVYACYARLPLMLNVFKGVCSPPTYDAVGDAVADCMARLHVPEVKFHLIPNVLPKILDGVLEELLRSGARCADIGCSGADCTIELAKQFNKSTFYAYEVADRGLERANLNVKKSSIENVIIVDAKSQPVGKGPPSGGKFDFVLCYDVLHDLSDPEAMMKEVRSVLAQEGVWLIVDITTEDDSAKRISKPGASTYYGFSVCLCLPCGLSSENGRGLGTLGFPVGLATEMFQKCGFSRVNAFKLPGLEKNTCFVVQI